MAADARVTISDSGHRSPFARRSEMRRIPQGYLIAGGAALLITMWLVALLLGPSRFAPEGTSATLQIAIAFVLTFLVVLIVRYLLLLLLGHLQHIENRGREDECTHQIGRAPV